MHRGLFGGKRRANLARYREAVYRTTVTRCVSVWLSVCMRRK